MAGAYGDIGFNNKADHYYREAIKIEGDSASYLRFLSDVEYNNSDLKTRLELTTKKYESDSFKLTPLIELNNALGNKNEAYNYALKFLESKRPLIIRIWATCYAYNIGYAFWQVGKKEEAK